MNEADIDRPSIKLNMVGDGWQKAGTLINGVIAFANVSVALIVLWQLWVLQRQLDESVRSTNLAAELTQKSLKIAEDALAESRISNDAQLRPWLTATLNKNSLYSDDLSKWFMEVTYTNVGKTPALDIEMYGAFELHEFPLLSTTQIDLLDSRKDGDRQHTNKVLLPGTPTIAHVQFRPDEVPKRWTVLRDGKTWLYALGHVRYFDVHGGDHHTQYCSAYSFESINAVRTEKTNNLDGRICDEYQAAD